MGTERQIVSRTQGLSTLSLSLSQTVSSLLVETHAAEGSVLLALGVALAPSGPDDVIAHHTLSPSMSPHGAIAPRVVQSGVPQRMSSIREEKRGNLKRGSLNIWV